MNPVYIVSAVRTPIGKYRGGLAGKTAPELGAVAITGALRRAGIDAGDVREALMGCVLQAGLGQNPARQAALKAGLPPEAGAVTLNMVCGSGMKAILLGAQAIATGDADLVVAGGMESMTRAPKLADGTDTMVHDGLRDAFHDVHMGGTCEQVAERPRHGL